LCAGFQVSGGCLWSTATRKLSVSLLRFRAMRAHAPSTTTPAWLPSGTYASACGAAPHSSACGWLPHDRRTTTGTTGSTRSGGSECSAGGYDSGKAALERCASAAVPTSAAGSGLGRRSGACSLSNTSGVAALERYAGACLSPWDRCTWQLQRALGSPPAVTIWQPTDWSRTKRRNTVASDVAAAGAYAQMRSDRAAYGPVSQTPRGGLASAVQAGQVLLYANSALRYDALRVGTSSCCAVCFLQG
jgi:hypothetical protein